MFKFSVFRLNFFIMLSEEVERAKRHARKEENLRKAFRGNSTARIESLKSIIRAIVVDKQPPAEYAKEIERLLAFPENFINCEKEYKTLFLLLEKNDLMKEKISSFKTSLQKINLPKASRRFLKD